jgi:hypothetical protein
MINPEMTYIKLPYKINVEDCGRDIIQKIQNELEEGQRKAHYLNVFQLSVEAFAESIEETDEISDEEAKKNFEIETTHPAFYNWLAYYLTLQNPNKIGFVLDMYASERYGPTENFNNAVEFLLVTCLDHVPFNHQDQDDAIVRWVREKNYPSQESASNENEIKTNEVDATDAEIVEETSSEKPKKKKSKKKSTTPLFQDEELIPNIGISKEWEGSMCFYFMNYLNNDALDRKIIIEDMKGRHLNPEHRIFLKMQANYFCYSIKKMLKSGYLITSRKYEIAKWIHANFYFNKKGSKNTVTEGYCLSLLTSKRDEPVYKNKIDTQINNLLTNMEYLEQKKDHKISSS